MHYNVPFRKWFLVFVANLCLVLLTVIVLYLIDTVAKARTNNVKRYWDKSTQIL